MTKISLYKLLYYSIVFYIISTMTQDLIPFLPLNRIFFIAIFFCVVLLLTKRMKLNSFIYILLIAMDILIVHVMYNINNNILDYIYFIVTIFFLIFIKDKQRRNDLLTEIKKHYRFNMFVIVLSVSLVTFGLLTKTGYVYRWGGKKYFVGYSSLTHTAASSMCLVISLILLNPLKSRKWISMFFLLILSYAIFETGARTFLVPNFVFLYLYIRKLHINFKFKYFIYIFTLILLIIFFSKSNMLDKFIYANTINKYNQVDEITQQTSGRASFWVIDLNGYKNGTMFDIIFGHGHGYTYYLNEKYYNMKIWAHNDFIQILVAGGILSLYIYISVLAKTISSVLKSQKMIDKILLIIYVIFPAFFNGFYNYFHFVLSFIFLVCFYELSNENNKKKVIPNEK